MTRHKHADVAEAFGNGKKIQYRCETRGWVDWTSSAYPNFFRSDNWRIKPAEPVVMYKWAVRVEPTSGWHEVGHFYKDESDVRAMWGDVSECKRLDYTRTEFPTEGEQ